MLIKKNMYISPWKIVWFSNFELSLLHMNVLRDVRRIIRFYEMIVSPFTLASLSLMKHRTQKCELRQLFLYWTLTRDVSTSSLYFLQRKLRNVMNGLWPFEDFEFFLPILLCEWQIGFSGSFFFLLNFQIMHHNTIQHKFIRKERIKINSANAQARDLATLNALLSISKSARKWMLFICLSTKYSFRFFK